MTMWMLLDLKFVDKDVDDAVADSDADDNVSLANDAFESLLWWWWTQSLLRPPGHLLLLLQSLLKF